MYLPLIIWTGEWRGKSFPIIFNSVSEGMRIEIEQVIKENQVPSELSYIVCVSSEDYVGYVYYLCRYLLWTEDISTRIISDVSQFSDVENYQYVLIYDKDNKLIQDWIKNNYPNQEGKVAISIDQ